MENSNYFCGFDALARNIFGANKGAVPFVMAVLPFAQGLTSTAWVVGNARLSRAHGSVVFSAAISHFGACALLAAVAVAV